MHSDIEQRARELLAASMTRTGCRRPALVHTDDALHAIAAALASKAQVQEDVRRAGAMLSNCAYNLAQREHLTADERRSLDEARQAWDAAMAAAPAPEVSG